MTAAEWFSCIAGGVGALTGIGALFVSARANRISEKSNKLVERQYEESKERSISVSCGITKDINDENSRPNFAVMIELLCDNPVSISMVVLKTASKGLFLADAFTSKSNCLLDLSTPNCIFQIDSMSPTEIDEIVAFTDTAVVEVYSVYGKDIPFRTLDAIDVLKEYTAELWLYYERNNYDIGDPNPDIRKNDKTFRSY